MLNQASLEHIRSFQQVAHCGGFRAAAQKMRMSQATLSAHIAALESALGVQLMARTTRAIRLTSAGERLLAAVVRPLEDIQNAVTEIVDDETARGKRVVLACTPSLSCNVVPHALKCFAQKRPDVSVDILDDAARAVESLVLSGEADVGLGPPPSQAEALNYVSVGQEGFAALVHSGSRHYASAEISLPAIVDEPMISMLPNTSIRAVIENAFLKHGLRFNPRITVRHHPSAVSLVEAGFGVTLLPRSILAKVNGASVRVIPIAERIYRELGVIQRRGEILSPSALALVHELRRALQRYQPGQNV